MIKTMLQTGLLILFFSFSISAAETAVDISGTWTLKMKSFEGDEEVEMVIKAKGEKLKITAQHPMFAEMSGSGRLKGNAIKFKLESKDGMPISIEFKGTVTGNTMSGTRDFDFGGGPGGFGGPDGPGGFGGFGGPPGGPMNSSKIPNEWTAEKK
jgi:hypothetical protein